MAHAYVPPGWSRRERDRYMKKLLVPNDPVIGRRAVAFLWLLALGIAAMGVVVRWL